MPLRVKLPRQGASSSADFSTSTPSTSFGSSPTAVFFPGNNTSIGAISFTSTANSARKTIVNDTDSSLQPAIANGTDPSFWIPETGGSMARGGNTSHLGVVLGVVHAVVLTAIGALCYWCLRRQRRRRKQQAFVDEGLNKRNFSQDMVQFPVHFRPDANSSTVLASNVDEKNAARQASDPFASSLDITTALTANSHTSANNPSLSSLNDNAPASFLSTPGSSDVEYAFQASLAARAKRMGLTPRQLLMLLTTSLNNQNDDAISISHYRSDTASETISRGYTRSDTASEIAFDDVSVRTSTTSQRTRASRL